MRRSPNVLLVITCLETIAFILPFVLGFPKEGPRWHGCNAGGPVFNEIGQCVGIAFQSMAGSDAENIGYVIPTPVINHFLTDYQCVSKLTMTQHPQQFPYLLTDVALLQVCVGDMGTISWLVFRRNGRFTGFPVLGVKWQRMESSGLKASYGLNAPLKGVLIRSIWPTSPLAKVAGPDDIIMRFDGIQVACDGTVPFRRVSSRSLSSLPAMICMHGVLLLPGIHNSHVLVWRSTPLTRCDIDGWLCRTGERIHFNYLISQKYTGEHAQLDLLRKGEEVSLRVPLDRPHALVPLHLGGLQPSYLVVAGADLDPPAPNALLLHAIACTSIIEHAGQRRSSISVKARYVCRHCVHGVLRAVPGERVRRGLHQ